MTSFTTIGVASDARAFSLNDHAFVNLAILRVLICVSGEYRVPARSRLYIGQSEAGVCGFAVCAPATHAMESRADRVFKIDSLSQHPCAAVITWITVWEVQSGK